MSYSQYQGHHGHFEDGHGIPRGTSIMWSRVSHIAKLSDTSDMPQYAVGDYVGLCLSIFFWHFKSRPHCFVARAVATPAVRRGSDKCEAERCQRPHQDISTTNMVVIYDNPITYIVVIYDHPIILIWWLDIPNSYSFQYGGFI